MSSDGDATEPASTVRHSYPPPAAVTSAEQVQTTGLGRRSSHGGEDTSKSNIGETSGTARPPTRASSYATADERDDEGSAIGAARPDSASQAASPSQIAAAAADAHEGGGDGEEEARSSRSRRDEDSDNHSISSSLDTTAMTPAAQLRLSLARRLWSGVTQLRSRSRRALLFQGAFTIAQVAAYIVMLALSAHQSCEKPLRVFIALHVIRVALAYPVAFYIALAPPGRPPRGEEDTPESRERREAHRVIGNPRLDARLRTASDLISLFSFVWFFLGNVWLYSAGQCRDTSPYMWYSSLSILIIAYIRIAELVIIVLAVVFFLPLVIIVLRAFGGLEKKHEIGPLSKEEIAKLPTVYYVPAAETAEKPATPAPAQEGQAEKAMDGRPDGRIDHLSPGSQEDQSSNGTDQKTQSKGRRRNLIRLLFKRKRDTTSTDKVSKFAEGSSSNGIYVPTEFPIHPLPDNLSSCPICLSDYEPPPLLSASLEEREKAMKELEPLTLLPCGHTIHKDCLAPWLQTSGRCPVCQKAVLGEEEGTGKKGRLRRIRANRRRQRENSRTDSVGDDGDLESGTAENQQDGQAITSATSSEPPSRP